MKKPIYINGRFLTQPITGVQRYGREIVQGFDQMLASGEIDSDRYALTILTPRSSVQAPEFQHLALKPVGRLSGHLWEQLELPWHCQSEVLFCPGNLAPSRLWHGGGKTILTLHDLSFIYFPQAYSMRFTIAYEFLVDLAIRHVTSLITVSESERQRILKIYPELERKLVSISSGVRPLPSATPVAALDRRENYVLFVGSINRIKNLERLMEAIYILQAALPISLKVVGTHSSKVFRPVDLSRAIKKVPHVEFLGQINDPAALHDLYARATLLAMPSYTESFGFPCLEAMISGCPVLASDIPALRGVCGDAAVYCDPFSAENIAEKILILWNHPEKRVQLVQRGYEQARQFTWERTARETWKVIQRAAESNPLS